jgi:hypothetical protein
MVALWDTTTRKFQSIGHSITGVQLLFKLSIGLRIADFG